MIVVEVANFPWSEQHAQYIAFENVSVIAAENVVETNRVELDAEYAQIGQ